MRVPIARELYHTHTQLITLDPAFSPLSLAISRNKPVHMFIFVVFCVNKFQNFFKSLSLLPLTGFFGPRPSCGKTSMFLCHSPCQKIQGLSKCQHFKLFLRHGHQFHTHPLPSEALAWPGHACPPHDPCPAIAARGPVC